MLLTLLLCVCTESLAAPKPDEPKPTAVPFLVPIGYFESNKSGLNGESSYLAVHDQAGFDQVFGLAFIPNKSVPLPKDTFNTKMVAAVIKRGKAITTYSAIEVTATADTLIVKYTAKAEKESATATFASPLIVAIDKAKYKKIEFIENGTKVQTLAIK